MLFLVNFPDPMRKMPTRSALPRKIPSGENLKQGVIRTGFKAEQNACDGLFNSIDGRGIRMFQYLGDSSARIAFDQGSVFPCLTLLHAAGDTHGRLQAPSDSRGIPAKRARISDALLFDP